MVSPPAVDCTARRSCLLFVVSACERCSMPNSRHSVSFEGVSQAVHQLETGKVRAVSDACHSLDRYLKANQENLRAFFTEFYLRLCQKIFGLGGNSLLGEVAFSRRDCDALLHFLDPKSLFFRAMVDVDTEHLNHYQLPVRMLSAHAQSMMLSPEGVLHSCCSCCNRIRCVEHVRMHIHCRCVRVCACFDA